MQHRAAVDAELRDLVTAAIHRLPAAAQVFAGQRAEGFYVDLGAIFDLAILRPFEQVHTTFGLENTGLGAMAAGVNSAKGVNVHSIAIEVPKIVAHEGRRRRRPTSPRRHR